MGQCFSPSEWLGGDRLSSAVRHLPWVKPLGSRRRVDRPFECVRCGCGELAIGGHVVEWVSVELLRKAVPVAFVAFIEGHDF